MANDPRGRWFRVYPLQVRQHPKFRDLTGVELGAWMALRAEAELREGAMFVDRAEAELVLRRRKIPRHGAMLDRLIALRLFDQVGSGVTVHDRADHDRGEMSSEQQAHRRDHRRSEPAPGCEWCAIERWDRSYGKNGGWVARGQSTGVDVDTPQPQSRGLPQQAAPATATEAAPATESTPPRGPLLASELPSEDDSATLACRQLFDSGKWLGDREYVAAWEDMDRRYTPPWVQAEIAPAFAACLERRGKVLPWDLKRMTESRLAERSRAEQRGREEAIARQEDAARAEREAAAVTMTPEERERQSLIRRAIGVWIRGGRKGKVPEKVDELRDWIAAHDQGAPA